MPRLTGKTALITGAARGIGAAIATAFTKEGAQVIITDIDAQSGQATADALGARFIRLDVALETDWAAVETQIPALDVLVNNAGITGFEGPFEGALPQHDPENARLEDWRAVHAVNLDGTFLGCRYAIRAMRERGSGSIINISSIVGWTAIPGKSAYVTAKASLRALTKAIATEAGPYGVRCNCLVPGGIETDLWTNWGKRMSAEQGVSFEEWKVKALSEVPLRTISQPEDIGNLALFLASDESRTITGQSINCDAGSVMIG